MIIYDCAHSIYIMLFLVKTGKELGALRGESRVIPAYAGAFVTGALFQHS